MGVLEANGNAMTESNNDGLYPLSTLIVAFVAAAWD